jgi:hypothetical protein
MKHQTPNTKLQRNSKNQIPKPAYAYVFEVWSLGFIWCLVFGVWCFAQP